MSTLIFSLFGVFFAVGALISLRMGIMLATIHSTDYVWYFLLSVGMGAAGLFLFRLAKRR